MARPVLSIGAHQGSFPWRRLERDGEAHAQPGAGNSINRPADRAPSRFRKARLARQVQGGLQAAIRVVAQGHIATGRARDVAGDAEPQACAAGLAAA